MWWWNFILGQNDIYCVDKVQLNYDFSYSVRGFLKCLVTNIVTEPVSPDNKVHGANMGPIWGRQDPGGPHVDPMNFVIWVVTTDPDVVINFRHFSTHPGTRMP